MFHFKFAFGSNLKGIQTCKWEISRCFLFAFSIGQTNTGFTKLSTRNRVLLRGYEIH